MQRTKIFIAASILGVSGLALGDPIELTEEARVLHRVSLVVDGHNDLPWGLRASGDSEIIHHDLNKHQSGFHTDIPRLRKGGLGAQFWSVYVPAATMDSGNAYSMTLEQIKVVRTMVAKYPEAFAWTPDVASIRQAFADGKVSSMIGVEGGHSIENSLDKLRALYAEGARYMTLTHSRSLAWADSATDKAVCRGLCDFGREVVREMNRLGMIVDISHVSPETMRDVLDVTSAPVIASHSSARGVYNHVRNVPDDILARIKQQDGVIMVNFYSRYLTSAGRGDVDTLLDHIDHIVSVAGIDHVGLGSDYDGVEILPRQLEDVSRYPYITQGLLNRGYSHGDIQKVLGENLMRVFAEVENRKTAI